MLKGKTLSEEPLKQMRHRTKSVNLQPERMLQQGLESRSSLIKEKQKKLILTKKQDVK